MRQFAYNALVLYLFIVVQDKKYSLWPITYRRRIKMRLGGVELEPF